MNQSGQDRVVRLSALVGWLPLGSDGATVEGCLGSSVQVLVDDDFVRPVLAGFHLTDIADGSTLSAFNFSSAFGRPSDARLFSPTGRWYGAFCNGTLSFLPEGGPAVTIPGLVQQVVDQLDPPDPDLAVTPGHGRHVVQMQSWLAVDPGYWHQARLAGVSAGRVNVTAWLTPTHTDWDLGNGDTETCFGTPGVVWRRGLDDGRSDCHYTYTWPSIDTPGNTYDLTGTVSFEVGYATNAPGVYGPFVPVDRSNTQTIEVVEIQAIETSTNT